MAAASSHGAIARLTAARITHKHTTSSLASGSSNDRCGHDNRTRVRARLIEDLKASALSVVAPATKPQSVNLSQGNTTAGETRPLASNTLDLPYRAHRETSERVVLGTWYEV